MEQRSLNETGPKLARAVWEGCLECDLQQLSGGGGVSGLRTEPSVFAILPRPALLHVARPCTMCTILKQPFPTALHCTALHYCVQMYVQLDPNGLHKKLHSGSL